MDATGALDDVGRTVDRANLTGDALPPIQIESTGTALSVVDITVNALVTALVTAFILNRVTQ